MSFSTTFHSPTQVISGYTDISLYDLESILTSSVLWPDVTLRHSHTLTQRHYRRQSWTSLNMDKYVIIQFR